MAWLCTTIAGSMPILLASCSAAPSARGPAGIGRVNEVCTIPSPVVSPYGRTMPISAGPKWPFWPCSATGHLVPGVLQELQGRVVGAGVEPDDAGEALAA